MHDKRLNDISNSISDLASNGNSGTLAVMLDEVISAYRILQAENADYEVALSGKTDLTRKVQNLEHVLSVCERDKDRLGAQLRLAIENAISAMSTHADMVDKLGVVSGTHKQRDGMCLYVANAIRSWRFSDGIDMGSYIPF